MTSDTTTLPRPPAADARRVVDDAEAVLALRRLVFAMRRQLEIEPDPEQWTDPTLMGVHSVLMGGAADRDRIEAVVGAAGVDALERTGAVAVHGDHLVSALAIWLLGGIPIAQPMQPEISDEYVYIGREAPWLIKLAWRYGPGEGRALDLATGTGVVAAALTARYERVTAADVNVLAVDCAALTLALVAAGTAEADAVVADVAEGLPRSVYDLVVGNPPWVPTYDSSVEGANLLYAHGGETGMELPERFIRQTTDLLAPAGVGIMLVCDTQWADGRRPLDDQLAYLADRGFETEIVPAHEYTWEENYSEQMVSQLDGCLQAQLVALVFRRPAC